MTDKHAIVPLKNPRFPKKNKIVNCNNKLNTFNQAA